MILKRVNSFKSLSSTLLRSIFIPNTSLSCLSNVDEVIVRQEPNMIDSLYRGENLLAYDYSIYKIEHNTPQEKLFIMKEVPPPESNYWAGNRRQIEINLCLTGPFDLPLLNFSKPIQLSFLSINRPTLSIKYLENPEEQLIHLGEISSPLSYSNYNYSIINEKYEVEQRVVAQYLQAGFFLSRLTFKKFQRIDFLIFDARDGEKVAGCVHSLFYAHQRNKLANGDLYWIKFPKNSSLEVKCRILGMTILNDFWVFGGLPKFNMAMAFA